MKKAALFASFIAAGMAASPVLAQEPSKRAEAKAPAAAEPGDPFMLGTCPLMDKPIDPAKAKFVKHEGRELRFCCSRCVRKFESDPVKHLKTIDAKMIEQQKPFYPLDTCVIAGEKLGSMGEPVDYIYRNRLVRFCCEHCIADFEKDPARHIAKLDEAAKAKQMADYPMNTCPVAGNELGKVTTAHDIVVGNRLVRLCCESCEPLFEKDPAKYLAIIDAAAAAAPARKPETEPKTAVPSVNPGPRPQDHHPKH